MEIGRKPDDWDQLPLWKRILWRIVDGISAAL